MNKQARIPGGATIWARQTLDSAIFKDKPAMWFKIWFYIVNRVNFEDNKWFERGECFIKYGWISDYTGATEGEIQSFLRWAKQSEMVSTRKTTRGMVVKVLNYDLFQTLDNYYSDIKTDTESTQESTRNPDGIHTIYKNAKNAKNADTTASSTNVEEAGATAASPRDTFLPGDLPSSATGTASLVEKKQRPKVSASGQVSPAPARSNSTNNKKSIYEDTPVFIKGPELVEPVVIHSPRYSPGPDALSVSSGVAETVVAIAEMMDGHQRDRLFDEAEGVAWSPDAATEAVAVTGLKAGKESIIKRLVDTLGIVGLDDQKDWIIKYGKNLAGLEKQLGQEEFWHRVAVLKSSDFHRQHLGKLAYIYREIKTMVPPPTNWQTEWYKFHILSMGAYADVSALDYPSNLTEREQKYFLFSDNRKLADLHMDYYLNPTYLEEYCYKQSALEEAKTKILDHEGLKMSDFENMVPIYFGEQKLKTPLVFRAGKKIDQSWADYLSADQVIWLARKGFQFN